MADLLLARPDDVSPSSAFAVKSAPAADFRALIVEDGRQGDGVLRSMLHEQMYRVTVCSSVLEAIAMFEGGFRSDIVFVRSAGAYNAKASAPDLLRDVARCVPVIAIAASDDARWVTEAVRCGASDALIEPFERLELRSLLQRHVDRPAVGGTSPYQEIAISENSSLVFCGHRMQKIVAQAAMIAQYDLPVLIMGESGTGKEILAQYIHKMSNCAGQTFLKVNCAAMPADLLESELLGYEQGAFTGATKSKPGKFELCDQGTIFLDEIGEMPSGLQAKILQVLQDGTFSRLGGRSTVRVSVRVIAATNIDMKSAIAERRFREDLYYRLNGYSLTLPPLRERRDEIPDLLRYFIRTMTKKYARQPVTVSDALIAACMDWPWPGNIRELENFVKRFLVLGDELMMLEELRPYARPQRRQAYGFDTTPGLPGEGLKHLVKSLKGEAEAEAISRALRRNEWRHKQTAAELKISYKALLYKIRQYRIDEPREQRVTPASTGTA